MTRTRLNIVLILIMLLCVGVTPVRGEYAIDWNTVDGGGSTSSESAYSVSGTIGQPDAGVLGASSDYHVSGGFWYAVDEQPPTISPIADQMINLGTAATAALPFTVSDAVTAADALVVTASSDNPLVVLTANILLTGPDATGNCSVVVAPLAGQLGAATITLTVMDGQGLTALTSFTLTVNAPPIISVISKQTLTLGTTSTGALPFKVSDDLTAPIALTVTASADNLTLVPLGSIAVTGPDIDGNCSVTVTPAAGVSGSAVITILVTDGGGLTATMPFVVVVDAPPTLTAIADQSLSVGVLHTATLPFTVGDDLTPSDKLQVTASSSNTILLPDANITLTMPSAFGNAAVNLNVTAGQIGVATITLSVTDSSAQTTSTSFTLTVYGVPTITSIPNKSMSVGTVATSALAFTVGDAVTSADALSIAGDSSNVTLVPSANIVFGGSGAARTVKITPTVGMCGVTTITLTVTNGGGQAASTNFTLTVYGPPTITSIANLLTPQGVTSSTRMFVVADPALPASSLTVAGVSSNATLVPNANIALTGPDAAGNCSVTLTPAAGLTGVTTIILSVNNGLSYALKTSFTLKVYPPPTITQIGNKSMSMGIVATSALAFTVADSVSPAAALTLTGSSSNTALVANANIVLVGPDSSGKCSVQLKPAVGVSGVTTIILTVTDDGKLSTPMSFTLSIYGLPTITPIANQVCPVGATPSALSYSVGDTVTPAALLTVNAVSSNTALVPNANIALSGPDAVGNCTVTVTPTNGIIGMTTITLTVKNGGGHVASTSLTFKVYPPPTISQLEDKTIMMGTVATSALAFMVADSVTPVTALTLAGGSSNKALVPNANIALGGSGAVRTVQLTPAIGGSGVTTITLTVTDAGHLSTPMSFTLTVNARPTITPVAAQTIAPSTSTVALPFTIGDDMTPVDQLTVTGVSNNQTLVPNANIVINGTGATRTVTVTPTAGLTGALTISLTVMDGGGVGNVTSFALFVKDGVKPPR